MAYTDPGLGSSPSGEETDTKMTHKVQQWPKAQLVPPGANIWEDILGAGGSGTQGWRVMGSLPGSDPGSHTAPSVSTTIRTAELLKTDWKMLLLENELGEQGPQILGFQ